MKGFMDVGNGTDDASSTDLFGLKSNISKKHFVQIDMQEPNDSIFEKGEDSSKIICTKKVSTSGGGIIDDDGEEGLMSARPMPN